MVEQKSEQRKLSLPLYLGAFVVTVLIFMIGIYVGNYISENAKQTMSSDIESISSKLSGTQLLFLLDNSSAFCPVYMDELSKLDGDTEIIGQKLAFLEDKYGTVNEKLKLQYFVLETEAYLLSKKVNEKCEDDSVLVLYFYSNKDCKDCKQQGESLLAAKNSAKKNVKIYSFDGELNSPVVTALKIRHSISTYPSVVVDDALYLGFQSKEQLLVSVNRE
ncbi:MAG: hypothetical protein Q7S22_07365 [Candidatus Micrarchaeota archaeon]|nr:hypothetical protein [Candidatus Micrarchaeota archaeon]